MKDIADVLKEAGYGVVEGEEAILAKIKEIGKETYNPLTFERRIALESPEKAADAFK